MLPPAISGSVFCLLLVLQSVSCLHVSGVWSTDEVMTIVAKFAFQRTDPMLPKETRGYVYGNVTANTKDGSASSGALLALVNFEHFERIYAHRAVKNDASKFCPIALKAATEVAFDARCSPNGKQDFFRKIPCTTGQLCSEEDEPENVVRGFQLTYQVQDKAQARFWFVLLLNCRLDRYCNWTSGSIDDDGNKTASIGINYDLWLVNGDPQMKHYNPFEHQFSFDQMDTLEIFVLALTVNLILIGLQWRAFITYRSKRGKFLVAILCVQSIQIACNLVHVGVFSLDGRGVRAFRAMGGLLELTADFMLVFLLICIAKGWTINKPYVADRNKLLLASIAYCVLSIIFYVWSNVSHFRLGSAFEGRIIIAFFSECSGRTPRCRRVRNVARLGPAFAEDSGHGLVSGRAAPFSQSVSASLVYRLSS